MPLKIILKALAIWFLLLVTAILMGAIRQRFLEPAFGEHLAQQIGTIAFCCVLFFIIYAFISKFTGLQTLDFWLLGLFWTMLTIIFEFGFFHFVIGESWEKLFKNYNLFKGRLWTLVLAVQFVSPYISAKLKKII
jgi:hypothetical protein